MVIKSMHHQRENWDLIIEPKNSLFHVNLADIWRYRDLLALFVKRDLVATYKQTLLGPLWFLLQPVFTIIVYYFMFGRVANIPTDGIPPLLFYMGGLVCWNYFSECINTTSNVFVINATLFGKVYFPRLIVPVSSVVSAGVKFLIQFLLFLILWSYSLFVSKDPDIHFSWHIALIPLLVLLVAVMGISLGIIISSVTTKYRDLQKMMGYALQFGLYASPIIFPLGWLREKLPLFYKICLLNPMTSIIETFKFAFLGTGIFSWGMLLYTTCFAIVVSLLAIMMFNKVEKTFVDTV